MTGAAVRNVLFCGLVLGVFAKLFLLPPLLPWPDRYRLFNVQALDWPGADSRNIQQAAHCVREGQPMFGVNECTHDSALVRAHYGAKASTPVLNYPSHWVRAYGVFGDDSEEFFIGFLRLNAVLLLACILACCLRYKLLALPLFVFSPITLLTVERANVDAITFFFTFVPLLVFARSTGLQSFFVGFAGALKVFPAAGWVAFARPRAPFVSKPALLGAAVASPLVIVSLLEIPHFAAGTARGFETAYGLWSLLHGPVLQDHPAIAGTAVAGVVIAMIATVAWALRAPPAWRALEQDLARLEPVDRTVLLVSLSIFLATFLLFTSWAYRLIFLIPACLVLSGGSSRVARLACLGIAALFAMTFAVDGWLWLNFACYPLAVLLAPVWVLGFKTAPAAY